MNFSEKQTEVITREFKDNTFEVYEGGVRSGKTTALVFRYAFFLTISEDENHLILGFNQEQAYKLIIDADGLGLQHIFRSAKVASGQYGDHLLIQTPNGNKRVYYKGGGASGDEKRFRGLSLGSVCFAEMDLLNMEVIQEAFRRTFASKLRIHFADLNPPAPQHPIISEVFEVQNTIFTHWTIHDNPIISEERKNELERILKKNPYLYKRDWLGERVMPQGVIYSMWNEENECLEKPETEYVTEMYFSADGGVEHATSVICWLVCIDTKTRKKTLYNAAEYFYSGQDTGVKKAMSEQAKDIVHKFVNHCRKTFGLEWSHFFVDPACLALIEELRLCGLDAERADNNAKDIKGSSRGIMVGIERMQSLISDRMIKTLATDKYGHYNFMKELSTYCIDKNGQPVGVYDDCMDAARYGVNYFYKTYVKGVV